jgi:hypothetical protein
MGPTLDRMVLAIDKLVEVTDSSKTELLEELRVMNQLLIISEQTRQDAISCQVELLLQDLQKSLSGSIDRMGKEFSESITEANNIINSKKMFLARLSRKYESPHSNFVSTRRKGNWPK